MLHFCVTSLSVSDHGTCVVALCIRPLVSLQWCLCPAFPLRVSLRGTMLSGSWRRGTVISSASGPGAFKGGSRSRLSSTVVLEAQYDYSYRAVDGRLVSIHEGERFLLLKKTNADWWQARRIGVGAKAKPIYVPATYVIELPISQSASESFKMIPRGSLTHCMQTHGSGRSTVVSFRNSLPFKFGLLRNSCGCNKVVAEQHTNVNKGVCYFVEIKHRNYPSQLTWSKSDVFCVIFRKNWNPSWVVLVGNSLVFFKDPKSQNPDSWKPGNSCPESSVDLRGAQLQWANDLSSRKNLRTVTGNEFLLQSETESLIREWYRTIQNVIDRLDKENPLDNVLLYSLRRAGSVEMLDQSGDEDENRAGNKMSREFRRHGVFLNNHRLDAVSSGGSLSLSVPTVPRSASNLENSEHKRVKSRLKKLILRRPPLQTLQEKGLIKDQVFGCGLELLCEREKSTVPKFVRKCTDAVERRGLETDGIYRVSGNLAVIQKLRFAVNHASNTHACSRLPAERLDLDDPQWEDIHVITGALKLFFRELPEPLVPYGFFHDITVRTLTSHTHLNLYLSHIFSLH
uniref:Rho GTPase activating protein 9 n=1 Tax=Sinocyclocheilus rhinocerous TaxID=307959 RepID=A0A673FSW8_9TELE